MNRPTASGAWSAAVEFSPYLLLFLLIVTSARPWLMVGACVAAWCFGFVEGFLEALWKRWKDRR